MSAEEDGEHVESLEKLERTEDMMVTAYSALRDGCIRSNRIVDAFEVAFSIIVITMTFYSYPDDQSGHMLKFVIVGMAMATLFLSLLKQKWDFGGRAEKYRLAADRCYEAKSLLRTEISKKRCGGPSMDYGSIVDRVDTICRGIEPIPERKFNRLKYKHIRKVGFSRYLSSHGSQWWIVSVIRYSLFRDER